MAEQCANAKVVERYIAYTVQETRVAGVHIAAVMNTSQCSFGS